MLMKSNTEMDEDKELHQPTVKKKSADGKMQAHLNIKAEHPFLSDNPSNPQSGPSLVNVWPKREPERGMDVDYDLLNSSQASVKQEQNATTGSAINLKNSCLLQENLTSEQSASFSYCDIPIKQEINDANVESLDIENESIDLDDEVIPVGNRCSNSGCNFKKQCLHTYTCSKCGLFFSDHQKFLVHFRKCGKRPPMVTPPSSSIPPRKIVNCQQSNQNLRKLIESVKVNPCLYNSTNEDYNDTHLIEVIWANIAYNCGFSNGDCAKAAWKKLKENFYKSLPQSSAINHQSSYSRPFKYQKLMEFLLPTPVNTVHEESNHVESTRLSFPPTFEIQDDSQPTQSKKQKVSERRASESLSRSSQESLHMFFMSMCETTKSLPPRLQLQVKKRVFRAVIEAEELAGNMHSPRATNHDANPFPINVDESSLSSQED